MGHNCVPDTRESGVRWGRGSGPRRPTGTAKGWRLCLSPSPLALPAATPLSGVPPRPACCGCRAPRSLRRRGGAAGLPPQTLGGDLTPRAARPDRARVHWAQGCLLRRLRRRASQRLSDELGRPGRETGLRSPDALQRGRPAATGDSFRVAVGGSKAFWESGRAPGGAALLGAPWCSGDAHDSTMRKGSHFKPLKLPHSAKEKN